MRALPTLALVLLLGCAAAQYPSATVSVYAAAPGRPMPQAPFVCVGSGHAFLGLRDDWRAHLTASRRDIGFQYVRFHGVFDDDMGPVVSRDEEGSLRFNFTLIDDVYDFILSLGMRPYVELSFMPTALASGNTTYLKYKGNVTPPRDLGEWAELIVAFASHMVERHGIDEVSKWFFEVWNEPNLDQPLVGGFWTGGQAGYFALYNATANAIKTVSPRLRVGGPTSAAGEWLDDFLAYTRHVGAPVDYIATHGYPTDNNSGSDPDSMLRMLGAARAKIPSEMPLLFSEYNSGLFSNSKNNDNSYAAAFLTHVVPNVAQFNLTALSYWTFSDVFEEILFDTTPFHDGFGLITVQGVPKPAYRMFQILSSMPSVVPTDVQGELFFGRLPVYAFAGPCDANSSAFCVAATVFETPSSMGRLDWQVDVDLLGSTFTSASLARIDGKHTNPREVWEGMGSPASLSEEQLSELHAASELAFEPAHVEALPAERGVGSRLSAVIPRNGVAIWRLQA